MGISMVPGLFLARNAHQIKNAHRAIILGRQKLHMSERLMRRFLKEMARRGQPLDASEITQADGFTEALFARLGYPKMEAMDFTASEGAEHIHDLNTPLPEHLHGQFDLEIDGGTSEHIFHIATALDTCHQLLKPGGVVMSIVSCDGWFGHGFFQTGPDVPWRYWHHARGYQMLEVSIANRKIPDQIIAISDPTGMPRGGERALSGPHLLMYAARRPQVDPPYKLPIRGLLRWQEGKNRRRSPRPTPRARRSPRPSARPPR